ncbi:MAG: hypothetical protein BGO29_13040 [Bacteroidales bacterium 36-12]|nr:MAG: hypothetical protein BGO29_13040 [Bacteroidales bacterium 36-12]
MYKKIYILVVILLTIGKANAQALMVNSAVQVWANFDRERGQLTFMSNNEDFCDYYVEITFLEADGFEGMSYNQGISAIVGRGKQQIRIFKTKTGASRYFYRYRYNTYRGNSTKKPNTNFIYALPVSPGNIVTSTIAGASGPGSHLTFDLPADTLYACRGGVMCEDNWNAYQSSSGDKSFSPVGLSQITLYHDDGSLSKYVFYGKPIIYAGQKTKIGNPIAVIEPYLDKYTVHLSIHFLDRNKLRTPFKYGDFPPFFQTVNEGKIQLKSGGSYTCELTDKMKMQEMSKGQIRKFNKNK